MTTLKRFQFLTFLIGFSFQTSVLSETLNLNIMKAMEVSLQQNQLLASNRAQLAQAEAGLDQAAGSYWPQVIVSTAYFDTDSPLHVFGSKLQQKKINSSDFAPDSLNNPGKYQNVKTQVDVNLPLYQGGALSAAKTQAKNYFSANKMGLAAQQQQLLFNVISAYTRIFQAKAQAAAAEKSFQAARRHFKTTQALNSKGIVIKSDVMDADVHRLNAEIMLTQARNAHKTAEETLKYLLNVDIDMELLLQQPDLFTDVIANKNLLIDWAAENRPDLLALKFRHKSHKAGVTQAKSAFKPRLDMQLSQQWNSDKLELENEHSSVAVQLKWNVFSGGSDYAAVNKASAKAVEIQHQIIDKQYTIRNEVRRAVRMLDEAIQRQHVKQQAEQQSTEALRIRTLRYKQGLEKTNDLLDSQAQLDVSRAEFIRAKYNVTLARVTLLLTAGKLNLKDLQ